MRYVLKNKVFSLGGSTTVRDETETQDLFKIKGAVFTFTKKKSVCDLSDKVLYVVRNRFLQFFLPRVYICDASGNKLLQIKKKSLFSFKQDFELVPIATDQPQIRVEGDYIGRHFDIYENDVLIAHVRKNFNVVKDSFYLDTDNTEKAPFLIAFVIAIDNYYDRLKNQER